MIKSIDSLIVFLFLLTNGLSHIVFLFLSTNGSNSLSHFTLEGLNLLLELLNLLVVVLDLLFQAFILLTDRLEHCNELSVVGWLNNWSNINHFGCRCLNLTTNIFDCF
jgi:hypothetical protein